MARNREHELVAAHRHRERAGLHLERREAGQVRDHLDRIQLDLRVHVRVLQHGPVGRLVPVRLGQVDGRVDEPVAAARDERPGISGSEVEVVLLRPVRQPMRSQKAVQADEVEEPVGGVQHDAARSVAAVLQRLAARVVEAPRPPAVDQRAVSVPQHGGRREVRNHRRVPAHLPSVAGDGSGQPRAQPVVAEEAGTPAAPRGGGLRQRQAQVHRADRHRRDGHRLRRQERYPSGHLDHRSLSLLLPPRACQAEQGRGEPRLRTV
jgi:hypothetical protein